MAETVKGITIEFRGDTTELSKAINKVRTEAKGFDKELGYINNSLKFNPKNVDLLKQKITVLRDATKAGEKNLNDMKKALADMKAKGIDETSEEYRELQREIIKAEDKQKRYNAELKKLEASTSPLGQASQKMADFGNKATKAGEALKGVSLAAAGIDAALIGLAYKSGQAADELNTLSKVTGISTTDLQKYKAAADLVDVSVETMAKSQQKLKKNMLGALDGTNDQAQYFAQLGINITNADGTLRDANEVFDETILALGSMTNETERDAIAMALMGKSATELNPLIEDGGETYQRVAEIFAANDLQVVDEATLQKANEFNDSLDTIKMTWTTAIQMVGTELAGYLAPIMKKVADGLSKLAGWLSKLSPKVLTIIGIVAGVVAGLAPLLILIGKVSFAISSLMGLMSTLGLSFTALAGPIGIAIAAIAAIIAIGVLLYKNWDTIKAKATQLKDWVVAKWTALKDSVVNTVTNLKNSITNTFNTIRDKVLYYWTALQLGISIIVNTISSWVTDKFNAVKNTVTGIFDSIKSTAVSVWDGIKNAIMNPIQTAIDFVRGALSSLQWLFGGLTLELPHIKLPHFSITGSFSIVPPSVPHLSVDWWKSGGIFTKPTLLGGMNGVGEAGAEAVLPLKKLWDEMDKRFSSGTVINVNASPGMDVNELALEIERRIIAMEKRRREVWV